MNDTRTDWQLPAGLAALGLALPLLAAIEPFQPLRALAAATVLGLLPGLGMARLTGVRDVPLFVVIALAGSVGVTVLASSALTYAGIWTWQLALFVIGGLASVLALSEIAVGTRR